MATETGAAKVASLARSGARYKDMAFAAGIIGILLVLFVPLPTFLLDIGLAVSISTSVLILMVALWIQKPLEFSSFPTVLLVVTMLRLALNIATTRLILGHGHTGTHAAGGVIEGFSQFVMGGNFVIGMIVFCILVTINFVVITKGATRIAEVAARFTLDAVPGKQMAIDADLSAGLIDEKQARERRKELEDESQFFGAMDGASKFVRGDAIAGIVITLINVVGGMIIGMVQHGMSAAQAAHVYTTLTVGDGLVSQIPALVVSLAAGMLVTKGGVTGPTNVAFFAQLGGHPKALGMAAALMATTALLPGFPTAIFLAVATVLGGLGWIVARETAEAEVARAEAEAAQRAAAASPAEPTAEDLLKMDDVRVDMGSMLVPLITNADAVLPSKVKTLRQRFAIEYGFILPFVRIKDNGLLPQRTYVISIHGVEVARGEVRPGSMLAINPDGGQIEVTGERTREPTFGLLAAWIDPALSEDAERKGYTVVDPESVITTHLTEVLKEHLPNLLTYAGAQRLVDGLEREYQKLVQDVLPQNSGVVLIQRVLQALLAERVSIRNLPLIVESIAEASGWTRNVVLITEHVRGRLSNQICQQIMTADGFVPVFAVAPEWEQELMEAVVIDGDERRFSMPPSRVQEFIVAARRKIQEYAQRDEWPAVLVNPDARPFVRSMLERISPNTPVISHSEVHRKAPIKTVDQIAIG